jgi:hypothetical protein
MSIRAARRPSRIVTGVLGQVGLVAVIAVVAAVVAGSAASRAEAPELADALADADSSPAAAPADGAEVELAPLVAAWPDGYTVTGTKSEPLYVEHITSTRDGAVYRLRIDVKSQGESALGVQTGEVALEPDGRIRWIDGCTKTAAECLDDPGLRGFLSQAALLAADRTGTLPATGVARTLHGHPVVCVPDLALHPDAPPTVDGLDPCFSIATGALLGHFSTDSDAFVGPTLAEGLSDLPR